MRILEGIMKEELKKIKCIIDTDPGVDDTAAIALSLDDDVLDIKLITTVAGNLDINRVTRNALHTLEKFKRTDIPVAKGAAKAMKRISPDAAYIHQKEGMGNYIPPQTVKTKPIKLDAVEAMYETIKKYPNEISIVVLGPHTNVGMLIEKHPDVVGLIKAIYCEGGAAYGDKREGRFKTYISFNASTDPEALEIVLESGIPVTYIPSRMGRELANFTEKQVLEIRDINYMGEFISEMYMGYWEPGYPDRRIALNDTCAVLSLRFPKLFKTRKVRIEVDTDTMPGKTVMIPDRHGHVRLAYKVNRKKLHQFYFDAVKKWDNFKPDQK